MQRPEHLLDPHYRTWDELLLSSLDATLQMLSEECESLTSCTWGRQNTLQMRHPLSAALPFATRWLDMPPLELPGDSAMPRVQGPQFGASERFVVSPGAEDQGVLQMPGGPVDHPLSPFYGAGHDAWVRSQWTAGRAPAVRATRSRARRAASAAPSRRGPPPAAAGSARGPTEHVADLDGRRDVGNPEVVARAAVDASWYSDVVHRGDRDTRRRSGARGLSGHVSSSIGSSFACRRATASGSFGAFPWVDVTFHVVGSCRRCRREPVLGTTAT